MVQLHEKSIRDVLELTISEAIQFFAQAGSSFLHKLAKVSAREFLMA